MIYGNRFLNYGIGGEKPVSYSISLIEQEIDNINNITVSLEDIYLNEAFNPLELAKKAFNKLIELFKKVLDTIKQLARKILPDVYKYFQKFLINLKNKKRFTNGKIDYKGEYLVKYSTINDNGRKYIDELKKVHQKEIVELFYNFIDEYHKAYNSVPEGNFKKYLYGTDEEKEEAENLALSIWSSFNKITDQFNIDIKKLLEKFEDYDDKYMMDTVQYNIIDAKEYINLQDELRKDINSTLKQGGEFQLYEADIESVLNSLKRTADLLSDFDRDDQFNFLFKKVHQVNINDAARIPKIYANVINLYTKDVKSKISVIRAISKYEQFKNFDKNDKLNFYTSEFEFNINK